MMSILQEQEEGTLARLFTTPTDRTAILAGKFLAVFLTVICQGIFLMIFARLAFRVDWGQPGSMLMALFGQVIAASGLGVLLISFIKNTNQGGPVLGGALTVLGMLGGLMTVAFPNMPAIFNQVSRFIPQGWVLSGWKLALAGQPPATLLAPLAVVTAMGVVMFALGALNFRRRLA
jgi:ABC-type multidrug transport system permease subunit